MTEIQAVRIPRQKHAQLEPLRTLGGLEIHDDEPAGEIWVRVTESTDAIQAALKGLPAATAYRVLEDGQLCRLDRRVPQGFIPEGPWENLAKWMDVELPRAALPGRLSHRVPLRLIRHHEPREANLLLATMADWLSYGSTAPQVRLDRWQFAVSADREVLIRGLPLPPIPGQRFVEDYGIAVPSGWHWSPDVDADSPGPRRFRRRQEVCCYGARRDESNRLRQKISSGPRGRPSESRRRQRP